MRNWYIAIGIVVGACAGISVLVLSGIYFPDWTFWGVLLLGAVLVVVLIKNALDEFKISL